MTTASLLAGVAFSLSVATPASAASVCDVVTGATEISPGVCQLIVLPEAGDLEFIPPSGTTQLDALLVAGGGAGFFMFSQGDPVSSAMYAYGGGGGDVKLVSLDTTQLLTASAGFGGIPTMNAGSWSNLTQGATTHTANGGKTITSGDIHPAQSGSGMTGYNGQQGEGSTTGPYPALYGGGGGSLANATNGSGGAGTVVNTLAGASTSLFADDTDCFGGGGGVAVFSWLWTDPHWSTAQCGGGAVALSFTNAVNFTGMTKTPTAPIANSGGGGYAWMLRPTADGEDWTGLSIAGADGVIYLRFAMTPPVPVLPSTGVTTGSLWAPFWGAFVALGLGAVALTRATAARRKPLR